MPSNTFYRMGAIALILSGVFTFSTFFNFTPNGDLTPLGFILDMISFVLLVPGFLVLYDIYKGIAPTSSLAAVLIGIAGILIYGVAGPLVPAWESIAGLIGVLGLVLPLLLFGISMYKHPQLGIPRVLGVIGIVAGLAGIINVATILVSGGDWQNVNSAVVENIVFITYAIPILLSVVWPIWIGLILLRRKSS